MPGGRRNPFSLSHLAEAVQESIPKAYNTVHGGGHTCLVDLEIRFIGASSLPKMDVVGLGDPYFVAKIDDKISFVSNVKQNTSSPVWNEHWRVRNVPSNANLVVEVLDKDEGHPHDDFIGKFKATVAPGAKEAEITHPLHVHPRGTFWLNITSTPAASSDDSPPLYLFDGPIRYSCHYSPAVGHLTNLNDARLYSTWKIFLRGVPLFFGSIHQHWNKSYKAAQSIFSPGPSSLAVRSGIQAGHQLLYARTAHDGRGIIQSAADIMRIMKGRVEHETWMCGIVRKVGGDGSTAAPQRDNLGHRVKPAVYTYIISSEDDSFRFSETGAAFFVDFASKHALHANCQQTVRYSGEFHPRPVGGWQNFTEEVADEDVQWEFVIDNNSGTYAPDKGLLGKLKELFEYNFPGFPVYAYDREDEAMIQSREACRDYAVKWRGVKREDTLGKTAAV